MFKTYRTSHPLIMICLFFGTVLFPAFIRAQQTPTPTPSTNGRESDPLKGLQWRNIGPFRGGRVTAVAGVTSQPLVYYFGATGGGVWKTR